MKILVVDDVEDNLELMRRWLVRRGHDVSLARDGESAVQLTQSERPDLVFMDISMPGMSGTDAIHIIRRSPDISSTPMVALTAHALTDERCTYLSAGADDVATKPVDFAVIRSIIKQVSERSGVADE